MAPTMNPTTLLMIQVNSPSLKSPPFIILAYLIIELVTKTAFCYQVSILYKLKFDDASWYILINFYHINRVNRL